MATAHCLIVNSAAEITSEGAMLSKSSDCYLRNRLLSASACHHTAQTISFPFGWGARGRIIVETHRLVVTPSVKPMLFTAWLGVDFTALT